MMMYINKIRELIELNKKIEGPVDCLTTVPSYYSSTLYKNKIKELYKIMNFNCLDIIPNYEAIALSYAYENSGKLSSDNQYLIIVDMGYISTSSTIVQFNNVYILLHYYINRKNVLY